MWSVAIVSLMSSVLFILSGTFLFGKKQELAVGAVIALLGLGASAGTIFIIAPSEIRNGAPVTTIDKGEYKVGFVHKIGDNVNLGIEKIVERGQQKREGIFLYQFPLSAFDGGSVNTEAKKLIVIESGYSSEFKRLVLK